MKPLMMALSLLAATPEPKAPPAISNAEKAAFVGQCTAQTVGILLDKGAPESYAVLFAGGFCLCSLTIVEAKGSDNLTEEDGRKCVDYAKGIVTKKSSEPKVTPKKPTPGANET
jgi:hypothetical protein